MMFESEHIKQEYQVIQDANESIKSQIADTNPFV